MKSLLIGVLLASALSACVVVPPRVAYRPEVVVPVVTVPAYGYGRHWNH